MKKCPICNIDYADDQLFCSECGAALEDVQPTPPPPPPAPLPAQNAPIPAPPPVKKKAKAPVALIAILVVVALLAAACAVFAGIQAFQFKENYETEQQKRINAEKSAESVQSQLDKLQLEHDKTSDELAESKRLLQDTQDQLKDANNQLSSGNSQLYEVESELNNLIDMLDSGYGFGSKNYYASRGVIVLSQYSSKTITIYEDLAGGTTFTFHTPNYGVSCKWNGSFSNGAATVTITGNSPGYYTISFTNDRNYDSFDILVIVTG